MFRVLSRSWQKAQNGAFGRPGPEGLGPPKKFGSWTRSQTAPTSSMMGTNVVPILANISLEKLEKLLLENAKQTKKKMIWPISLKRFIDDGFGIIKGSGKDFDYWVSEFHMP